MLFLMEVLVKKNSILSRSKIVNIFMMCIILSGCGDWLIEKDYCSPTWKNTNTIYCIEREHKQRYFLGFFLHDDLYDFNLVSIDTEGAYYQSLALLSERDANDEPNADVAGDIYCSSSTLLYCDGTIKSINEDGSIIDEITVGMNPKISRDGQQIAYVYYNSGKNEVWTCNINGTNKKKIWDDTIWPYEVSWSSDSTKMAILSADGPGTVSDGIYIVDINSLENTFIGLNGLTIDGIDWSPVDGKIAYCSGWLYTIDMDGSNNNKISSEYLGWPKWSSDGEKITGCSSGIIVINKDGSGFRILLSD